MSPVWTEDLRQRHRALAYALLRRSTPRNELRRVSSAMAQLLLPAAAFACWLENAPPLGAAIVAAGVFFWSGSRLRLLANLMHECVHGAFATRTSTNRRWGLFLAAVIDESWSDYARIHLAHHRHLATAADPDLRDPRIQPNSCWSERPLAELFQPRTFLWMAFRRTRWNPVLGADDVVPRETAVTLFWKCALLGIAAVSPDAALALLVGYALPLRFSTPLFRHFSDVADHGGLNSRGGEHSASRDHHFRLAPLNALFFPNHDAWHRLHHLFPELPARLLPELARRMKESSLGSEPEVCNQPADETAQHQRAGIRGA